MKREFLICQENSHLFNLPFYPNKTPKLFKVINMKTVLEKTDISSSTLAGLEGWSLTPQSAGLTYCYSYLTLVPQGSLWDRVIRTL